MNFENLFFEAFASKLLEDTVDSYGNKTSSPIIRFVNNWVEENREKITKEIIKNISIEEVSKMVVEKVKSSLTKDSWGNTAFQDELKKETMRQLACENVKTIMKEIEEKKEK